MNRWNRRVGRRSWSAVLCGWAVLAASAGHAGDWPQILGSSRNGAAEAEPALTAWGEDGPAVAWSYELGEGFAGPAVVGQRVVVFHRIENRERVEAVDASSGKPLWKTDFDATYRGGFNPDTGPRCVPLVRKDRVYVLGAAGDLHCLRLSDGQALWSRPVHVDFSVREGYFGAGSTPIVADNKLLMNVGGAKAGLVAFNPNDGDVVWQATDEAASYSSPTSAQLNGQSCVIFVTRLNVVGIDPRNGAERFRFPFGRTGPTVNAATPLVFDDFLFVSASYGVGAQLAKIGAEGVRKVWANDQTMSSQYSTCVHHQGFLYGAHGREDVGIAELRCFEAQSGQVRWRLPDFGVAHLILVNDQLLVLTTAGTLHLAPATPDGFQPVASARISPRLTQALPALSNGKLFIRDNDRVTRHGRLMCLTLAER